MAIVKGFPAVRYNSGKVELSTVVTPPYDIISPLKQKELHNRSPYNYTWIDFPRDVAGEDKYAAASARLNAWLKEQVLIRDDKPSIYFYRQQYTIRGETKRRFGFLALLKLEEGGANVHGHEHTHAAAKEDRFKMITKAKANLSPIFVVFEDKKRLMEQNLKPWALEKEPLFEVADDDKVLHAVWRIDDPQMLERVAAKMKDEDVFIADGHHRYEVSCAYRNERRAAVSRPTGEEDFNYILAYFTNVHSQGLTILPIHRVVSLEKAPDWDALGAGLREYFSVEEIKGRDKFLFLIQKAGQREHAVGLYAPGHFWLLRLKNMRYVNTRMPDKSAEYRSLDVAILNTLVFKNVLGVEPQDVKNAIGYTADAEEAMSAADNDPTKIAFLLNPTRIDQIVSVASHGEKMPPKSTYFYPKVESGLVVYKFEE